MSEANLAEVVTLYDHNMRMKPALFLCKACRGVSDRAKPCTECSGKGMVLR